MKKGRALEILVSSIEKSLTDNKTVTVTSPKRLKSKINGNLREFDVVIELKASHHDVLIAFECKDRKAPVGDPEIESFYQKCIAVNIDKGMFVSTSGYTEGSLKLAKFYGIKCISIDDIGRTDWLAEDAKIVVHSKRFLLASYGPIFELKPIKDIEGFTFFASDDKEITDESIKNNLAHAVEVFPCYELNKEITYQIRLKTKGAYIKCNNDQIYPIKGIYVDVTYICETKESDFIAQTYKDYIENISITEIASAKIELDGKKKKVALVNTDSGVTLNLLDDD